jgi:hypothetical protein
MGDIVITEKPTIYCPEVYTDKAQRRVDGKTDETRRDLPPMRRTLRALL